MVSHAFAFITMDRIAGIEGALELRNPTETADSPLSRAVLSFSTVTVVTPAPNEEAVIVLYAVPAVTVDFVRRPTVNVEVRSPETVN